MVLAAVVVIEHVLKSWKSIWVHEQWSLCRLYNISLDINENRLIHLYALMEAAHQDTNTVKQVDAVWPLNMRMNCNLWSMDSYS